MIIDFSISKYKHFELQLDYWKKWTQWFCFEISLNRKVDHEGFRFNIEIMFKSFHIWIYDTRHYHDPSYGQWLENNEKTE